MFYVSFLILEAIYTNYKKFWILIDTCLLFSKSLFFSVYFATVSVSVLYSVECECIVACRPVVRLRQQNKQLYNSRC
jgi:hypothetical protein